MKFKINLKPYPGEPYFTVREHKARFRGATWSYEQVKEVEVGLRTIFDISDDYIFNLLPIAQKKAITNNVQLHQILDDPSTGKRGIDIPEENAPKQSFLDLSYSFPYIPEQTSGFNHILIDPNASLGVPCNWIFLFSKIDFLLETQEFDTETTEAARDLFVLNAVLRDIADKGSELSIRECNYKAAVLYQLVDSHSQLFRAVAKVERSKTCIAAICDTQFRSRIEQLGYDFFVNRIGENEQITISNYLTHSKESIEMFADRVAIL